MCSTIAFVFWSANDFFTLSCAVVAAAGILYDWSTSPDGDAVTCVHLSWIALAIPSHMARVW
jgi:hypothetical protein